MKAKTCAAAVTLIGMSFGQVEVTVAQTRSNAPREPVASGAIVVPPGTGDSETMQKAPPAVGNPRMVTPPPAAGKDALPDTTRPQPVPGPILDDKKKPLKPS